MSIEKIPLLSASAQTYEGGEYHGAQIQRYYGSYLPRYYRWAEEQVPVVVQVDTSDPEEAELTVASLLSLTYLIVENRTARRAFLSAAGSLVKLAQFIEKTLGTKAALAKAPPSVMVDGALYPPRSNGGAAGGPPSLEDTPLPAPQLDDPEEDEHDTDTDTDTDVVDRAAALLALSPATKRDAAIRQCEDVDALAVIAQEAPAKTVREAAAKRLVKLGAQ